MRTMLHLFLHAGQILWSFVINYAEFTSGFQVNKSQGFTYLMRQWMTVIAAPFAILSTYDEMRIVSTMKCVFCTQPAAPVSARLLFRIAIKS